MKNEEELHQALTELVETLEVYVQQQARMRKMIHQIELLTRFMKGNNDNNANNA